MTQNTTETPRAVCAWCLEIHETTRCPYFAQLERGRATVPGMDVTAAIVAPHTDPAHA